MGTIKVGIIGASSITAEKLIKLLLNHKHVSLELLVSENNAYKSVGEIHKGLKGLTDKKFEPLILNEIVKRCDCVFLCKGHGEFIKYTIGLVKEKKIKVIDLSADFRLKDPSDYEKWYKFKHTQTEYLKKAIYGLTELYYKDIKKTNFVANPGCYPTSIILALVPLFKHKLVNDSGVSVNSYSGVSGAGTRPNERNMALAVLENIMPYKVCVHQHTPEIEQELSKTYNKNVSVSFVPNVVPFKNGILSTSFVSLKPKINLEDVHILYKKFYKESPFVRVYRLGEYPEIKNVVNTNFCDIGFAMKQNSNKLVVISAIDNIIKGASGQAIQNMNVMFGFDETECLM